MKPDPNKTLKEFLEKEHKTLGIIKNIRFYIIQNMKKEGFT